MVMAPRFRGFHSTAKVRTGREYEPVLAACPGVDWSPLVREHGTYHHGAWVGETARTIAPFPGTMGGCIYPRIRPLPSPFHAAWMGEPTGTLAPLPSRFPIPSLPDRADHFLFAARLHRYSDFTDLFESKHTQTSKSSRSKASVQPFASIYTYILALA